MQDTVNCRARSQRIEYLDETLNRSLLQAQTEEGFKPRIPPRE
jgi:hypothetical protein